LVLQGPTNTRQEEETEREKYLQISFFFVVLELVLVEKKEESGDVRVGGGKGMEFDRCFVLCLVPNPLGKILESFGWSWTGKVDERIGC
jgi:hypothetical protein